MPAVDGTNISGPLSPTIDGLPTGGLPPVAKLGNFAKGPPKIEPRSVFITSLKNC